MGRKFALGWSHPRWRYSSVVPGRRVHVFVRGRRHTVVSYGSDWDADSFYPQRRMTSYYSWNSADPTGYRARRMFGSSAGGCRTRYLRRGSYRVGVHRLSSY